MLPRKRGISQKNKDTPQPTPTCTHTHNRHQLQHSQASAEHNQRIAETSKETKHLRRHIITTPEQQNFTNGNLQNQSHTQDEQSRRSPVDFTRHLQIQVETQQIEQAASKQEFQREVEALWIQHATTLEQKLTTQKNQHQQEMSHLQYQNAEFRQQSVDKRSSLVAETKEQTRQRAADTEQNSQLRKEFVILQTKFKIEAERHHHFDEANQRLLKDSEACTNKYMAALERSTQHRGR